MQDSFQYSWKETTNNKTATKTKKTHETHFLHRSKEVKTGSLRYFCALIETLYILAAQKTQRQTTMQNSDAKQTVVFIGQTTASWCSCAFPFDHTQLKHHPKYYKMWLPTPN